MRVSSVADVPPGEVRVFEANGGSICLANVAGRFFAIDNVCTHDGGTLGEGILVGDAVECPRHGALFDVTSGQAKTLPAVRGVRRYEVRIVGDDVQIALDE